jgi:Flp pilus assembly pilin Flp
MRRFVRQFSLIYDDRGTAAIEYTLLASLIGLGIIAALNSVSGNLNATFSSVVASL